MTTCTFAGHREVYRSHIAESLEDAIRKIITSTVDDTFCFYVGGMGEFDKLCASAVRKAKRLFPDRKIFLNLVLPYLTKEINESKAYYEEFYDDVVIPMELAGVHYKSAITKRNRWMIEQSDWLIAYVERDFGGAYTTMHFATKQGLQIINLAESNAVP